MTGQFRADKLSLTPNSVYRGPLVHVAKLPPGLKVTSCTCVCVHLYYPKVSTGGRPIYYVSSRRDLFTPMKLPKYTLPKVIPRQNTDSKKYL